MTLFGNDTLILRVRSWGLLVSTHIADATLYSGREQSSLGSYLQCVALGWLQDISLLILLIQLTGIMEAYVNPFITRLTIQMSISPANHLLLLATT